MKKLEFIHQLGENLRKETLTLLELEIFLAIHSGMKHVYEIAEYTGAKHSSVSNYITEMTRRGELDQLSNGKNRNPATYALSEPGMRIILACIPSDNAIGIQNPNHLKK